MKLDIETVSAMLANESLRHVQTRVLAQSLAEYTEHTDECASVPKEEKQANKYVCDCGLGELIEKVDAL